ncbi:alkaline phosphatase family protein [Microbacterium betulae]|uniref:Alkaline phosphatase family protein n=1 Tax=Microbacterium betulae TaxID=2981139 RepID=A0AA97FJ93_9MICO|nr:alkaline phosphatase family protein [Microbacterium sp. AB]WOF24516.1 alkaline phosphatase family protein [Microbacterium sp. AB]
MSFIVPAGPQNARSLTEVAAESLRSLAGEGSWLAPASSVVLVVVDGLGAIQLRGHAGHARRLSGAMTKRDVARSVFPSTTAAALTSTLTGAWPGEHGLVGYRVLDPTRGVLCNQLNGYGREGLDPLTWQRAPTVFERASAEGRPAFAVGRAEYARSGFTSAVLRGAQYVGEDDVRERLRAAYALAAAHAGAIVYCYLPEADKAGHRHGIASDAWVGALEEIDAAFADAVPRRVGVLVTADHGMVDVPRRRHVLLGHGDPRLDGVALVGGEPRLLHLYLDPGAGAAEVAGEWRRRSEGQADVSTRDEAIASGLFGDADAEVRPRIGDVLVAARGTWAFYDDRETDKRPQDMVGQHGSTTPEETTVPLIRLGAFAGAAR